MSKSEQIVAIKHNNTGTIFERCRHFVVCVRKFLRNTSDSIQRDKHSDIDSSIQKLSREISDLLASNPTAPILTLDEPSSGKRSDAMLMWIIPNCDIYFFSMEDVHSVPMCDNETGHFLQHIAH